MATETYFHGICKQVNQGDSIIVREKPVNGPPPTKTIGLTNITCPRIQFRPQNPSSQVLTDEKFAWEAREFLRHKVVGQHVVYTETRMPKGGIYGDVYLGQTPTIENNLAYMMVSEGFAEVRKINNQEVIAKNKVYQQLVEAENVAKAEMKGRWNAESKVTGRSVCWSIADPGQFLQNHLGKDLPGIVEYVRDGSTMQISIFTDNVHYPVMISLAGVKTPTFKMENNQQKAEKFADEAKFFVESRLLQRDVTVRLISSTSGQNFLAIVKHPRGGDISEHLLAEGLARCLDWGMDSLPPNSAVTYRQKELDAKNQRKNTWSDYKPPAPVSEAQLKLNKQKVALTGSQCTGVIVEVGLGDNVTLKCENGALRKFYLASLRPVRISMEAPVEGAEPAARVKVNKPLYDIPYMWEAREFLRKHIGKKANVHIDYTLPKQEGAPQNQEDRICATVEVVGGPNLAQGLISRGLAQLVRYGARSTDPRAKCYDLLQIAENEAKAKNLGYHSKGAAPVHKITEITGNASKSILPVYERAGVMQGLVEFVATAGRLKVFLPQYNNVITVLLSGVDYARTGRTLQSGAVEKGDPMGEEATQFTREHCLQRNVEVEVETVDRAGNFIGSVYLTQAFGAQGLLKAGDNQIKTLQGSGKTVSKSLSVILVLQGFATVNKASRTSKSSQYSTLLRAQVEAQAAKNGFWSNPQFLQKWQQEMENNNEPAFEPQPETPVVEEVQAKSKTPTEASVKAKYKTLLNSAKAAHLLEVCVGDCVEDVGVRVFLQLKEDAPKMDEIQRELNAKPPTASECAAYTPQKGQMCAAKFSQDKQWYRAQIVNMTATTVTVHYVDFGNSEDVELAKCKEQLGPLAGKLASAPLVTKQYRLAGLCFPPDMDARYAVVDALTGAVGESAEVLMAVESQTPMPCYKEDKKPVPLVVLFLPASNAAQKSSDVATPQDLGEKLLNLGLVYVERARMAPELRHAYEEKQNAAKKARLNIWRHGDCRPDD